MANGKRRRPAFWILLAFLFLGIVGQAVPALHRLALVPGGRLRRRLHQGPDSPGLARDRARAWRSGRFSSPISGWPRALAPPTCSGSSRTSSACPAGASIEPLVRRLLVPVTALIAFVAGARGSAGVGHRHRVPQRPCPFGRVDPLFGRDLGFYFFELPFWRLLYGWGIALAAGTLVLTAAVYVVQRSHGAHRARALPRRRCPDPSPRPGRAHPRAAGGGLLASTASTSLLVARGGLRGLLYRRQRRPCRSSTCSRCWRCSARRPASCR